MGNTIIIEETAANPYTQKHVGARGTAPTQGGSYEVNGAGEVLEKVTIETSQPLVEGTPGDILKSARTPAGAPVTTIEDSTILTVNGITTTAKSAARAGLVTKNADGSYSEVAPQKAEAPVKPASKPSPLSVDSRARLETIENLVGPANTRNILSRVASAAGRGEGLKGVAVELADLGGISPEVTETMVNGIAQDLIQTMEVNLVQGVGMNQIEAGEALQWMMDNLPKQHVASLFSGALYGDTQALSSAYGRYRLSQRKVFSK